MHVVPSQHRGRYLKIHLYHSRRQYEYKVFVVANMDIKSCRRQYGYKSDRRQYGYTI